MYDATAAGTELYSDSELYVMLYTQGSRDS